jgi:hypothetical protein
LISKRPNVHHLLYDEVIDLIHQIQNEFSQFISLESIGKTHENRDILMIKVEADEIVNPGSRKKAILMTGAHHSRELVSVQMPLYMLLDLLHGSVHGNLEKIQLLK